MSTSHCTKCGKHKKCFKHHLYVIQLNKKILGSKKFLSQNKHIDAKDVKECFYVGETTHKPYCRFKQHKAWFEEKDSYDCRCEAKKITRPFRSMGRRGKTKGSNFAGKYGIELRPDLYGHLNPVSGNEIDAIAAEIKLAEDLRKQGHAVWQN